jgi:two-component sensor histidine kinase
VCWQAELRLQAVAGSPKQAREWITGELTGVLLNDAAAAGLVGDAQLVVSELVTNSFKAGSPTVAVTAHLHRDELDLAVYDTAAGTPVVAHPGLDDPHGRGLLIVEALCTRWGVRDAGADAGKAVWALLPVSPALTGHLVCRPAHQRAH